MSVPTIARTLTSDDGSGKSWGHLVSKLYTSERVSIGETGSVEGAISAPRLVVAVGARVQGRADV